MVIVVVVFSVLMTVYVLFVLRRFTVSVVGITIIFASFFSASGTMFYSDMEIT